MWFRRWLQEGYTIRQLSLQSGHSQKKLRAIIQYWLGQSPPLTRDLSFTAYSIFDGIYLIKSKGVFAVMDVPGYEIVFGQGGINEGPRDLGAFCRYLKERGFNPKSATVDGNPHLIKTLQHWWPEIIIQRCLVHIQRQGLSWCRQDPKSTAGKHLRRVFLLVNKVSSSQDLTLFLEKVKGWEERYGKAIASKPERGWVFSDLKRARSMLLHALPNMFHYLEDPQIPKSTNGLEGYFARLRQRYRQHRGLAKERRLSYFLWYFYCCKR